MMLAETEFHWGEPELLWVPAVALPLLGLFLFWSWRVKQNLIRQFIPARLLPLLTVGVSPAREKFRLALLVAAVAAILLALARPQWGFEWVESTQRGLDIVVAVDTSRSMLAPDVTPNRLEKARLAAFDLMGQARQDRLGLVAFAGSAFLQCPLTLDDEAFRQSVEALNVGIVPMGGTAISAAIRTALEAFGKGNDNHKVMVLFTDGEDHDIDTDTDAATKAAADAGMKIFTVGVGTAAGELIRVPDAQGNLEFIKDEDGNVVKSHLNEGLLEKIATATGGFYIPLQGANPMEVLYSRGLAPLPKSEATTQLTKEPHDRYHWFLGFAIVCLLIEMLLPERSRERRAETGGVAAASGLQKAAVLLLLLLPLRSSASTPGAYDKYESGDYQGAFDEYSRLSDLKTNDYRLHYNAGTAAYRAKQLDAAEKQLGAALSSPGIATDLPTQERAYFNLGNTLYHLGEPMTEPDKKQERWEQAIANYGRALQLDTNDLDAKSNIEFVKKKIEELKQQQQQQQQQNQNQKNQDNKQQKDQDQQSSGQKNKDQKNQQGQQQKSAQQNKQDDKNQSQAQKGNQDKQKEEQQKQAQAQQDKRQQEKPEQAKAAAGDKRDKQQNQNADTAAVPGEMSLQQAEQMLDAARDDEKALIFSPQNQPAKTIDGKIKDW